MYNGRAGRCCEQHHPDETTKCCKHCPMEQKHTPLPVWRSMEGKPYCSRYYEHEGWVEYPCEAVK